VVKVTAFDSISRSLCSTPAGEKELREIQRGLRPKSAILFRKIYEQCTSNALV